MDWPDRKINKGRVNGQGGGEYVVLVVYLDRQIVSRDTDRQPKGG